jgi:nuclease S1
MRLLIALVAGTAVCLPGQALAWGQEGHSIVAEIAQRRLSPQAEAAVRAVLGNGSLAAVSTWPDDVRASRPTTTKWHFADIPLDKNDYNPERDCKPDPVKGDCVVAELERLRTELRRGSRQQKLEALMFAVHFVGDIHQPLHTIADKGGGNGIDVTITAAGLTCATGCPPEFKTIKTNFHRAWDSDLIHRTVFSWGTYVDRIETGWLKTEEARKIGIDGGKPADWVVETHRSGQTVWHLLGPDDVIDDKYFDQALPVLDRQLGVAGLRLARFLNETFETPSSPAPQQARRNYKVKR